MATTHLHTNRSRETHARARSFLPGGVTGDGRFSEPYPVVFERASGKWMTDLDGNVYLDYHGGFGTAILGYAHPEVDEAVQRAIREVGAFVGVSHRYEVELAERLCASIPGMERVAFCGGGGSDAVYHALRLARAATGRPKIVKMEGGYQGWHSEVAISTRPPVGDEGYVGRPAPVASSAGILPSTLEQVLVLSVNDQQALRQLFVEQGSQIAALIIEPVLYSSGCVLVDREYLALARDLCTSHGSVLIFDEVMSGFRNGIGGAGARAGVVPDLGTYGKAVANGYMMSFVGGKAELMTQLAPEGPVFYSGTFNGHPISMAAAQKTLDVLERDDVPSRLWDLGDGLRAGIEKVIAEIGIKAVCQSYGSVWNVYLNATSVRNYREFAISSTPLVKRLNDEFRAFMRDAGIYIHKRHVNRCFVSAQHDDDDVSRTVETVAEFLENKGEALAQ